MGTEMSECNSALLARFLSLARWCVAPAFALTLLTPALAQRPIEGFWTVTGRGASGMRCGSWSVRLAVEQGRLTGVVGVAQGNIIIQNLVLQPDGSFSGNTVAGHVNHRSVRAYSVVGRFQGNLVSVTLRNEICPDRAASGRRQWTGY
jgi:hypothetical protein